MKVHRTPTSETIRDEDLLVVGIAQLAPVWLDRTATLSKVEAAIEQAAADGCTLVVFG